MLMHGAKEPLGVTSGLVLYLDAANARSYPKSGTTWFDRSGNGNNGTLVNGVGYNGSNYGSLSFDGVDDRVNVSSSALGISSGTLCFWIKSATPKDIYNSQSGDWNQNTLWAGDVYASTGNLTFRYSNGTLYPGDVTISSSLVFDNQFHFVCTTWTTGGERAIWLDGTKRAFLTGTLQCTPSATLEIGYKSWSAYHYNGGIYSIASYNRALSAAEVKQNYNATKSRYGL